MFNRTPKERDQKLIDVEDAILTDMLTYGPDAPEYPALLEALEKVTALKSKEKRDWSYDSAILVAGNLLGILVIVAYEQKHVFTSKGLTQLLKSK